MAPRSLHENAAAISAICIHAWSSLFSQTLLRHGARRLYEICDKEESFRGLRTLVQVHPMAIAKLRRVRSMAGVVVKGTIPQSLMRFCEHHRVLQLSKGLNSMFQALLTGFKTNDLQGCVAQVQTFTSVTRGRRTDTICMENEIMLLLITWAQWSRHSNRSLIIARPSSTPASNYKLPKIGVYVTLYSRNVTNNLDVEAGAADPPPHMIGLYQHGTRILIHQPSPARRSIAPPTVSHDNHSTRVLPYSESPFVAITEDLRNPITNWKGHPLSGLGPLQMYDLLSARRDALVHEFYVYLFKEAIICVPEEESILLDDSSQVYQVQHLPLLMEHP